MRKCRTCSRSLFFTAAQFRLASVAASISHFVIAATQNFHVVLSIKKCLLRFFISLSLNPCRPFSCLASLACLPTFSFSLSFSCSIFQICGHDNLSRFNTLDNTDTETISAFRLRLYWLFIVSALQDAGGYAISRQNDLELYLGYDTCWLSHFTLVCLWCGRCTVTWLQNFLGWVDYFIFTHGASRARAPLKDDQCKQ